MALIFDPETVAVVGVDDHLASLDGQRLNPQSIRARLAAPGSWTPEFSAEPRLVQRPHAAAAVLIPIVTHPEGLTMLLTRRSANLRDHAGQISFPGGRSEPGDADAAATALRESAEEIGLSADHVEIVGHLPVYATVTAFQVTPVLGFVRPGFNLQLDKKEVEEVFEVPLAFLMNPAHHRRHAWGDAEQRRVFLSMPWSAPSSPGAPRYFIWGATAAMIRNLYSLLAS